MQFATTHRAMRLLWKLMEGDPYPAVLPMRVQKVPFRACREESTLLPRALPEETGIDSQQLESFIQKAAADRGENLHSITILRQGKVIAERSFGPYDRTVWHATHSLCKTVTALGIGILLGEGRLSLHERVTDIFAERCTAAARRRYEQLKVFHLLTMTSGVSFSESQSVTEFDWVRGYLDSLPLFPVGERFHYNSMNTYMLAAIICKKTGKSLQRFMKERLFNAMGIRRFCWETCPMQIEKGGWGLYLLQEDAAKLGQLILNGGSWNGDRLVPAGYMQEMCAWHSDPPKVLGEHGYGYQCWLWEREGSVQLSGLFGQTVLVVPDLDMVIAANAGAGRMLGESAFLRCCSSFLREIQCKTHVKAKNCSTNTLQQVTAEREKPGLPRALRREGVYRIRSGFARLLPVFMQLLENVYTTGIERIGFIRKGTELYVKIDEGTVCNTLRIGFSAPVRGEITVNGEVHLVAVLGKWTRAYGREMLRLEIAFLEQASTRCMDFLFENGNSLRVRLFERPGKEALLTGAAFLFDETAGRNPFQNRFMHARLQALAEPELHCVLEK